MIRHLCVVLLALSLAGPAGPTYAADPPPHEGVDVKKSRFLLLPKSTVENSAAQQYAQMMRGAAQKDALNNDRRQVERLRDIARKLIPPSARFNSDAQRWRWEVNLISSKSVNAFCMPGGKIAFYTGIISALKLTDDEVAVIMGHEVAHALLEHGRARMSEQVLKNVGVGVAAMVFNLGQVSASVLSQAANVAITLPFSRHHETDADLVGMELAARAGYDPRAAANVWRKMSQLGGGQPPQFLSTHPAHATRIKEIETNLPRVLPLYEAARAAMRKADGETR
ncbi:MAG: M48 family peptidase [Betaproteobacteria bacterium]|nr:M48 family peptidase [Betaproteobacteria bacterium]